MVVPQGLQPGAAIDGAESDPGDQFPCTGPFGYFGYRYLEQRWTPHFFLFAFPPTLPGKPTGCASSYLPVLLAAAKAAIAP